MGTFSLPSSNSECFLSSHDLLGGGQRKGIHVYSKCILQGENEYDKVV